MLSGSRPSPWPPFGRGERSPSRSHEWRQPTGTTCRGRPCGPARRESRRMLPPSTAPALRRRWCREESLSKLDIPRSAAIALKLSAWERPEIADKARPFAFERLAGDLRRLDRNQSRDGFAMTGDGHDLSFDSLINKAGKSRLGVSEVDGQHVVPSECR